jgi:glycosyltransferase involved in cell wall biosynthesis
MKRLLMVAFHFPPFVGSSGIQRTIGFARHLPQCGWEPVVLSAHPRAYERVSEDQLKDIPSGTTIERAFAVDSARHLSLFGRYPGFAARPDRWVSWWFGAVPKALSMIRKYRPHAIWSTYPIATAHMIGQTLQRLSGLPWIADFRDPMAQEGYPADPKTWERFRRIEEHALRSASYGVFVAPGAARVYRERYPAVPAERIAIVENGYDEENFTRFETWDKGSLLPRIFTLVHSGIVYPSERDPTHLFRALRSMLDDGRLKASEFRLRLRASAHEAALAKLIDQYGVTEIVELAPPIPYRGALQEMARADGLLVLQASNCNDQIPAKVYEYLRCRRPILALTDPAGDTASVLRKAGIRHIAPLDSAEEIALGLLRFLDQAKRGEVALPDASLVTMASRSHRARELANLLDHLPIQK